MTAIREAARQDQFLDVVSREEAEARDLPLSDPEAREIVYGMPYKEWQARHQVEATAEQKAAFARTNPAH